jgi:ParB-like chromosome segregation protein Spo0J
MSTEVLQIESLCADLHRLQLPFAPLRIQVAAAVDRLARSIEQCGQLVPVVAAGESAQSWTLIDGYRRVDALRRCGRDRVWVELWQCPLSSGLLRLLARGQARAWLPLEEAALIRELMQRFDCSQRDIARDSGRDVSWVSRRLALIDSVPETVIAAVRRGDLSSWAASRIMVPLARANTAHAEALLERLQHEPLSTRELAAWFERYQHTHAAMRERLVREPALLINAWRERRAQARAERLALGPQGSWLADLKQHRALSQRLHESLQRVFEPTLAPEQQHTLINSFARAEQRFAELTAAMERYRPR